MKVYSCQSHPKITQQKNWIAIANYLDHKHSSIQVTDNAGLYHYAGNNPIRYIDPDGRNDEEAVRKMIYEALDFIRDNLEKDDDILIANKLNEMMNNGKIQIDDVRKRYETFEKNGHGDDCLGFFDPWRDTVTGERRNIIVIDKKNTLKFGLGELIDTLMHEGCHAVQSDVGFIVVDNDNNKYVKNSDEYIERNCQ